MALIIACASVSVVGMCHEIERVDTSIQSENLAKEIPDGLYEVVGFESGNDKDIHFGVLATETDNFNKLKMLPNNYLLYSRWEDPKILSVFIYDPLG